MRFLLVALTLFFSVQEKEDELKTHFSVRVESSLMGATDVVEVTPHQMTKVRNSWRVENSLSTMANLYSYETEYLRELITSEEFKRIESPSIYECIDTEAKAFSRRPSLNLYVTVEEAGDKYSKSFTFNNCICTTYLATDAPEVLCNILGDVNRLNREYFQR